MTQLVEEFYRFIALAPNAPRTAEATAIIAFRMISHTDFSLPLSYTSFLMLLNSCINLHSIVVLRDLDILYMLQIECTVPCHGGIIRHDK